MNQFVLLVACISAVYCAPPRPGYSPNYSQVTVQRSIEIPFNGNKPAAWQGRVSARQEAPKPSYGPPPQTYGPPQQTYGPPPQTYGPPIDNTTFANNETTTEPNSEPVNITQSQKIKDNSEDLVERGVYYIYHPNGVLQRVVYATKDDLENMAYLAKIKYEDVEPIVDPVYTYDPETFVLQRVVV